SGDAAVFLFKPCDNLGCAFTVEGHSNDGLPLIGGKVAALAVMINAIPALLGTVRLVSVVMCSFSFLHSYETKLTGIIPLNGRWAGRVIMGARRGQPCHKEMCQGRE